MDILLLLVPLSIVLVAIVGLFLFWAIGSGQFEQLDTPGEQVLLDYDAVADSGQSTGEVAPRGQRLN